MVVTTDQLLASKLYTHVTDDFVHFLCLDDSSNTPLMLQLNPSRVLVTSIDDASWTVVIDPVDSTLCAFEEQAMAHLRIESTRTSSMRATMRVDTCVWFTENDQRMDFQHVSSFTCVPIVAIHGFSLSEMAFKYEVVQVRYIPFRVPTLPDLSQPLFI
jgi:hypothetical protein